MLFEGPREFTSLHSKLCFSSECLVSAVILLLFLWWIKCKFIYSVYCSYCMFSLSLFIFSIKGSPKYNFWHLEDPWNFFEVKGGLLIFEKVGIHWSGWCWSSVLFLPYIHYFLFCDFKISSPNCLSCLHSRYPQQL